jgi:hypothetical protein
MAIIIGEDFDKSRSPTSTSNDSNFHSDKDIGYQHAENIKKNGDWNHPIAI